MDKILGFTCFLATLAITMATDCSVETDGNYEIGCKSYTVCANNVKSIVDCDMGKVYNNATGGCDLETNVGPPCGLVRDCTGKADGQYPDNDQHCHSYYTCYDEKFLGHNPCPANLVYDDKKHTCNYPDSVAPPCGTLTTG